MTSPSDPFAVDWRDPVVALRERTAAQASSEIVRDVGVAGACLSFRSDSRRALEALVRPVVGLPAPAADAPRLVVDVRVDDVLFRDEALRPRDEAGEIHPRVRLGDGRETLGAAWPGSAMLAVVDRRIDRGHVVVGDPGAIGLADAVTLVRALVAWWLASAASGLVHAAAVAGSDGAVLLTGVGGAGKSSTAAAAFARGLDFLGDDAVFCRSDAPTVFCVNTFLSLFEEDFASHYGSLGPPAASRDGKAAVDAAVLAPARLRASAPIRAVVAVERGGASPAGLREVSRGRVLASLAPSSVFIVPNDEHRTMSMIAGLLRRVPCYALGLEPDRARVADALRPLVGDGSAS